MTMLKNGVAPPPTVSAAQISPRQAGYHAGVTEARSAETSVQDPGYASLWRRCTVTIPAGDGGLLEWLEGYAAGVQSVLGG